MLINVKEILNFINQLSPFNLKEDYDNVGLIIGNEEAGCTGIVFSLDFTESTLKLALENNCNVIINHHPIIFKPLKKIVQKTHEEKMIFKAIKNNINIIACHTNIDNCYNGVSQCLAKKIGLINQRILLPKNQQLMLLDVYTPKTHKQVVLEALFEAGAGKLGNYENCSFSVQGEGSFKAKTGAKPFVGKIDNQHFEEEIKIEVVFPIYYQDLILKALKLNHPYETIAYRIVKLENYWDNYGSGMVGELPKPLDFKDFLDLISHQLTIPFFKYTSMNKKVVKIAVCGGSGSFLIPIAQKNQVDCFISSEFKLNEFFQASTDFSLIDIGHYESEKFIMEYLFELFCKKFPNFANLKINMDTNPVTYYFKK